MKRGSRLFLIPDTMAQLSRILVASNSFVNDPAFPIAPHQVSIDDFRLAWSEIDYRYAAIQPTEKGKQQ
jgi:hypothetical protein